MCTVSFYPSSDGLIFTSNRDEQLSRDLAILPEKYIVNNIDLYFPRDPLGGGSWFVVNQQKHIFILLNGAKEKHIPNPPYRLSRGLVLLDISSNLNPLKYWEQLNLEKIEPFTIIAYFKSNLYQLRWDSISKSLESFDLSTPRIWSSSTLYTTDIIRLREQLFEEFISNKLNKLNQSDLLFFHTQTNLHDSKNGLIINRENKVLTKNVTQCTLNEQGFRIHHKDLIQNLESELIIEL